MCREEKNHYEKKDIADLSDTVGEPQAQAKTQDTGQHSDVCDCSGPIAEETEKPDRTFPAVFFCILPENSCASAGNYDLQRNARKKGCPEQDGSENRDSLPFIPRSGPGSHQQKAGCHGTKAENRGLEQPLTCPFSHE